MRECEGFSQMTSDTDDDISEICSELNWIV
jgi:hypothetical protein